MQTEPQQPSPNSDASNDTNVVGLRVVQYLIDSLIAAVGAGLSLLLFLAAPTEPDGAVDSSAGSFWLILAVIVIWSLFWVLYVWVLRPYGKSGRTFGMQMFGIRIVSADGSEASRVQLLLRTILLVVDAGVSGLIGLTAMLLSKRHQRVGDMAASTIVCRIDSRAPR